MEYMDNSILNKNIETLKKYYPVIAEKTEEYISEQKVSEKAFVDMAVDGSYIAGVVSEGRDWYFNSRYNPYKAAIDWVAQFENINFQSLFVIMGMANGMYVRELLNKLSDTNKLLMYEPCSELFFEVIRYVDISDIISDARVYLVVGEINIRLLTEVLVMKLDYSNMNILQYATLPNYEKIYTAEWRDIIEMIKDKVNNIVINRNTQISFKYELTDNMFSNYQDMVKEYTINQIRYALSDIDFDKIPAILVAAGPSLDKNINELAGAKGKAFIIAVDTALNSMAEAGVIPDISITVDPHKPVSLFQAECMKDVPMIVSQYSNSDVVEVLTCKKFYSGEMDYMSRVYMDYGKEMAAPLETGGSVANNAFSFLQYVGFKRIVLVGQDLAYTGNKEHTSSAYKEGTNQVTSGQKHQMLVDAVGGGKVLTSDIMHVYNTWFENQIARYPGLEVINATEGGSVKTGSIEMTLRDVIEKYCKDDYDFSEKISRIEPVFSESEQEEIRQRFNKLPEEMDKCKKKIKTGIDSYDRFLDMHKKNKASGSKYKNVLKDLEEINKYADTNPVLILASIYNVQENYEVQSEVYDIQDDELQEVKKIHSLGVKMLQSYIDALDEMKEDIKYLTNSCIIRKFALRLREALKYLDYASYEYRKQNFYKGSQDYIRFSNWIKYVISLYMNHGDEIRAHGIEFDIKNILGNLQLINNAMDNKDYIYVTDIMQYNLKGILTGAMIDIIGKNLIEPDNNERENMTIMKAMEPELYLKLTDDKVQGNDFDCEFTSYAYSTLKQNGDNGFYFHSNQNPMLEARIQLDNTVMINENIAILGIGLGYIADELVNRAYAGTVYFFETDINVLRAAMKRMDIRKLYTTCRVKIMYDPELVIFSKVVKQKKVDVFFNKPAVRNIKNEAVRKIVEETEMNINSAREQKMMLKLNLKSNLDRTDETLDAEKINISGKTVICVAGGASLDNDIEELKVKSNQDDKVIIAVGTVYKKLRNAGIVTDYVLITDAKESLKSQITDVDTSGTVLLYLSTVNRAVVEAWNGEKRIAFQNGMDEAELYALRNNLITVDTGGSVSTTAISIAVKLGASKIVCVGLDLALVNGYTHASGTNAKKIDIREDMRRVKSINGEEIPTYVNLDIYRHWIERYIKDIDNVEFINCSGGAYIEGMINMKLCDI